MTDRTIAHIANEPAHPVALSAATIGTADVFTAGQVGVDLHTGVLAEGFEAQVEQAIDNLEATLNRSSSGLDRVLRTTCYLTDPAQFAAFEAIYGRRFSKPYPARTTVVATLLGDFQFEIDAVAVALA